MALLRWVGCLGYIAISRPKFGYQSVNVYVCLCNSISLIDINIYILFQLPPNADHNSTINLVVNQKTNHLRCLIDRQKSKKTKNQSNNKVNRNQTSNGSPKTTNNNNRKSQQIRSTVENECKKKNEKPRSINEEAVQKKYEISRLKYGIKLDSYQYGSCQHGYVTDDLRLYLEASIIDQMVNILFIIVLLYILVLYVVQHQGFKS